MIAYSIKWTLTLFSISNSDLSANLSCLCNKARKYKRDFNAIKTGSWRGSQKLKTKVCLLIFNSLKDRAKESQSLHSAGHSPNEHNSHAGIKLQVGTWNIPSRSPTLVEGLRY